MNIPTEAEEQVTFVQYLRLKRIPHFRVPSETYTTSWSQKAKNKALGVVRGVPDLFVVLNHTLVAIEMKRTKGATVSPEQSYWIDTLNNCGVEAVICYGAKDAIAFIEEKSPV